jgi:hypothetical protein
MTAPFTTRVRVRLQDGVRAQGAGPAITVGPALGLQATVSAPPALDLFLGALGGELLNLLLALCRREGLLAEAPQPGPIPAAHSTNPTPSTRDAKASPAFPDAIDSIELSLTARVDHALVALGVVGETGRPRIAAITGTCHLVSLDEHARERLPGLWQQALDRSVLLGTLAPACPVEIRLNVI